MKKRSFTKRLLFFSLKLFLVLLVLAAVAFAIFIRNLKQIFLQVIRSNYPELIVSIGELRYEFPMKLVAKDVHLRHVDDVSAASVVTIPRLEIDLEYERPGNIIVRDLAVTDYHMTIDYSRPDAILPFLALAAQKTGEEVSGAPSRFKVTLNEVSFRDSTVKVIGPLYELTMQPRYEVSTKLNISVHRDVKGTGAYSINGSLRDFIASSPTVKTRPLEIELAAKLPPEAIGEKVLVKRADITANGIPLVADAEIWAGKLGYNVLAKVEAKGQPANQLVDMIDYYIPFISEFDIQAPLTATADIAYNPDATEYITIRGQARVPEGHMTSASYSLEFKDIEAVLPFEYHASATAYSWILGGEREGVDSGRIAASSATYDRYEATRIAGSFFTDGTNTVIEDISFRAYGGRFSAAQTTGPRGAAREQKGIRITVDEQAVHTSVDLDVKKLDFTELLQLYEKRTFNIDGKADGQVHLALTGGAIDGISVDLVTTDGRFMMQDLNKSLAALPSGEQIIDGIKQQLDRVEQLRKLGGREAFDRLVKAFRNFPYEKGVMSVGWAAGDHGTVDFNMALKAKEPIEGVKWNMNLNIPIHGITSFTDLFNMDKIIGRITGKN